MISSNQMDMSNDMKKSMPSSKPVGSSTSNAINSWSYDEAYECADVRPISVYGNESFHFPPIQTIFSDGNTVQFSLNQTLRVKNNLTWIAIVYSSADQGMGLVCHRTENVPWGFAQNYKALCRQGTAEVYIYAHHESFTSGSNGVEPRECNVSKVGTNCTVGFNATIACSCKLQNS